MANVQRGMLYTFFSCSVVHLVHLFWLPAGSVEQMTPFIAKNVLTQNGANVSQMIGCHWFQAGCMAPRFVPNHWLLILTTTGSVPRLLRRSWQEENVPQAPPVGQDSWKRQQSSNAGSMVKFISKVIPQEIFVEFQFQIDMTLKPNCPNDLKNTIYHQVLKSLGPSSWFETSLHYFHLLQSEFVDGCCLPWLNQTISMLTIPNVTQRG